VKLEDTIASFERVVSGEFDQLPEQAFYMQGASTTWSRRPKKWPRPDARIGHIGRAVGVRRRGGRRCSPGIDGLVGFSRHAPFMTLLGEGVVKISQSGVN